MDDLVYDPIGLELIAEMTPASFREWNIQMLGGRLEGLPQSVIDGVNDPEAQLAPLLAELLPGDQLWRCRKWREPLIGHEGIALVRQMRPIIYIRIRNY
ncbi:hypothetical protein [Agrobacterium cavarae]|uniref:hypothetical protein n=1 Tax=Agrobacterium cavarae TaxID=2528239 RepID=UPI003FD3D616